VAAYKWFDFASWASAYRRAAEALASLNITEQSAPQGARLRVALSRLAELSDSFDKALEAACKKADMMCKGEDLALTEDGSVYILVDRRSLSFQRLEIEPALVLDLMTYHTAVEEAAISLGLEDCAVFFLNPK